MKSLYIYRFFDFLKFNKNRKGVEEIKHNPVEALKPQKEEPNNLKRKLNSKVETEVPAKKLATIKFNL